MGWVTSKRLLVPLSKKSISLGFCLDGEVEGAEWGYFVIHFKGGRGMDLLTRK